MKRPVQNKMSLL